MSSQPAAPAPGAPSTRHRPAALEAAGLVVGLVVLVALVFVAFALPGARTAPRHVPVGVAGPAPVAAQVEQALAGAEPGAFDVTAYGDGDALRRAVRNRDVYGGFVLGAQGATTVVASGGSPVVAQALTALGQQLAARSGSQARVEDLAPLPSSDPRGLGLAGAGLPIVIGGLVSALLLVRRFPGRPWLRVTAATGFAVLAGLALAAILQFWFGSIDQALVRVALGLSLGIGAISLLLLGLESLFGRVGFGLGAAVVLLLGNPLSGLTSAPELLPAGWGALGQLLPPGATGTVLRSDAYFGGVGANRAVLVLSCWAAFGLLLTAVAALRRRRTPAVADVRSPGRQSAFHAA
jgi:hypothetical protein